MTRLQLIFVLIFLFVDTGCVSVGLKPKAPTRSESYKYSAPPLPFEEMDSSGADISWQNPKSGNTIAIISECSEMKDPALSDLENDAAQAFSAAKVVQTTKETFSDREALRSQIQGTVDGIAVKMDILTFKKNSCNYSVTFMGRLRLFDLDHSAFEQFLKGFSVP